MLNDYNAAMVKLSPSRFNPTAGVLDFWNEFRKPNPYRWPILFAATLPFMTVFYWLSGETAYKNPERPTIVYIPTLAPDRSDAEIIASNLANQEVKELREADAERRAKRKRELYKALGAAAGMDVDEIERRADIKRAKAEAAEAKRLDEMFGENGGEASKGRAKPTVESSAP